MYRLDLFKRNKKCLKDVMPFARIVEFSPSVGSPKLAVTIGKDGSFMTTWRYRGPDLDSAVKEEMAITTRILQEAIGSVKTGWVMHFEAQRTPSTSYPEDNYFPDPITKGIDMERRYLFAGGNYFESTFYNTLYWMPPKDSQERIREMMVEGREHRDVDAEDSLNYFYEAVMKFYQIFKSLRIPTEFLDKHETLTYLHSTISADNRKLTMPEKPMLLDQMMFYDTPLYGGIEPRLGRKHIRVITPIDFGTDTVFGYFDALNQMNFPYRWTTRCVCMSKSDVLEELEAIKRKWKGKLQSILSLLTHRQNNVENNNETVEAKLQDVRDAINAVEADTISYVYYTTAVVVMDEDREVVEERAKLVRQVFVNLGMKQTVIEDVNALDAWFGSIPGMLSHNVRRPLISTGNMVHMMPLSDIWAGHARNKHLNGPALIYTQTTGNTPFRLNLHVGDVGHSLVVGPTGAGKSVLLNCLEASFRKYKDSQVIIFDKGSSSKVLTTGVGGKFYDLGSESGELSFQPLAHIDDDNERQWAQEWLCDFLRQEGMEITPEIKGIIRDALGALSGMAQEFRTISGFVGYLQDFKLKEAFSPLALADSKGNQGEYGAIFDSDTDNLEIGSWQTFEMEKLMASKMIVGPALMYIFHRIEQSLTGAPTLIVLDECWVFFDNPMFAEKIREWLKVLRKYNASVVFATQSLVDITKSPLLDTILTNCQSRIFLPNTHALEEGQKKTYETFGLNQRQIEIIAAATPKRQYYYDSPEGSRLFDLALEYCPFTLSYVAVDKKALNRMNEILNEYGREEFNRRWLLENQLDYPEEKSREEIIYGIEL